MKTKTHLTYRQLEGMSQNYDAMSAKTKRKYAYIILTVGVLYSKAKLGITIKTRDANFFHDAKAIASALRANTGGYYNPEFDELDDLDEDIRLFGKAMEKVKMRVLGSVARKNKLKQAVKNTLDNALAYINKLAKMDNENAGEIITGAKMLVALKRKKGGKPILNVKQGKGTGIIELKSKGVQIDAKYVRTTYFFEYSIDDKKTWLPVDTCHEAKATANNMAIGVKTFFRTRSRTAKGGYSVWTVSEAIYPT